MTLPSAQRPLALGAIGKSAALFLCGFTWCGPALADPPKQTRPVTIDRICDLIQTHAAAHSLPPDLFARLIWKESRFDPGAVSPAGAEGIAQFMPGTAALRGLADPFDVEQAIPASAAYLSHLKVLYGNFGLAAAAYNAGEQRVSRWLVSGGFLPMETENYVLDILGEPADNFAAASYAPSVAPLNPKKSFKTACRDLPVVRGAIAPMARAQAKPWGVQVAGNFNRSAAIKQYQRIRSRFSRLLSKYEPVVSRVRSPIGRRGVYAVRIGADSRADANSICSKLQNAGAACVVTRNH
jgi:hypothetical protein